MNTKLDHILDGIIEAAWLVAVMVVPLFFDIYSSRIFEPDKITLLRSLAILILAAWIVKVLISKEFQKISAIGWGNWLENWIKSPLVLPVIGVILVLLLSSIFSVNLRVSIVGSYQRLQGTYTTLSYLVIFGAMVANLRSKKQVDRLIVTIILTSLPISLYGILQRYGLDPIPWGGDVSSRIASNMGNSIFAAAYFIMVFPLTFMRIADSFETLIQEQGLTLANFSRATVYVFIAALQVIALYFTGSRGPWLGWGASVIFLWLGFSLIWRKRWLTIAGVVSATLAALFLITLNIPGGPLESLRTKPELRRLGQLLDAESRTGRVRTLIWQGASQLVVPHQPLEFPDGKRDVFNFLRPLIGYGPESMYVAYNPFYPPELTQVEKRNASPDRSHNETWDSLVTTGLFGLLAYLTLFGSVIYFGLKWLGLVQSISQRNLFLLLYILGGVISTAVFISWKGVPYFGVALPFGMIAGVVIYLIVVSLGGRYTAPKNIDERWSAYLLIGLLAAVVAHFVEINFGIAIAATRTYFWVYAALMLLVGYVLPQSGFFSTETGSVSSVPRGTNSEQQNEKKIGERASKRRGTTKRRRTRRTRSQTSTLQISTPEWLWQTFIWILILGVLLATLGFNYITHSGDDQNAFAIIWNSLTSVDDKSNSIANGIYSLFLVTWILGSLMVVSENYRQSNENGNQGEWVRSFGLAVLGSLFVGGLFWLWHASALRRLSAVSATSVEQVLDQVKNSEALLSHYYLYIFLVLIILGYLFYVFSVKGQKIRDTRSYVPVFIAFPLVWILILFTNLRVIQADIAFKTADLFTRPNSWPVAIQIYQHAIDLAPNEDYYYLFLGRAYLEHAKGITDTVERDRFIVAAASDLKKAQQINPLNTDHTANLARLYSLWATFTDDANLKQERALISNEFFSRAVALSPNNARLWDEWALLYLNIIPQPDEAQIRLEKALEIDPYYDWTYALLGELYSRFGSAQYDPQSDARQDALKKALDYYSQAYELAESNTASKVSYAFAMSNMQMQMGLFNEAIATLNEAIALAPKSGDRWRLEITLAQLYAQIGDLTKALEHAQLAQSLAPENQRASIQEMIMEWMTPPED